MLLALITIEALDRFESAIAFKPAIAPASSFSAMMSSSFSSSSLWPLIIDSIFFLFSACLVVFKFDETFSLLEFSSLLIVSCSFWAWCELKLLKVSVA